MFALPHTKSFPNKVYAKRKDIAPKEREFFSLKQSPFQKEGTTISTELPPLEVHTFRLISLC